MTRRVDSNELRQLIAVEISRWNSRSLEDLACHVLLNRVKYVDEDAFEIGNIDDMRLRPQESK